MGDEMKKFLFFLFLFFINFYFVSAIEVAKVTSITSRCVLTDGNRAVIPIKVISLNEGMLSSKLGTLNLGDFYNADGLEFEIENIDGKNINQITIDDKKDSSGYSKIYFSLLRDTKYNFLDEVMEFRVVVTFESLVDSVVILGNKVILSDDKNVCNNLNNYNMDEINLESVELLETKQFNLFKVLICIIVFLVVLVIVMGLGLMKLKRKDG